MDLTLWIVLPLAGFGTITLALIVLFNQLVAGRNQIEQVEASIDALLTKRFSLLPNLVTSVKKYAQHEQETLTQISALRSRFSEKALPTGEKLELDQQLNQALQGLQVQVEAYPELKADSSFATLIRSLTDIENQIASARRAFNAAVTSYNNLVEMFPGSLLASACDFRKHAWYEAETEARQTPDLQALFQ